MKFIMKNGSFWIGASPGPAAVAITAAAPADPLVLTMANSAAAGDTVIASGTGWPTVDNRPLRVVSATATTITTDVDGSAFPAIRAGATARVFDAADFLELCLAGLELDSGTVESITIGTYCDAGAALAGAPSNGTVNINGFLDVTDPGYQELERAAADGIPRTFKLVLPQSANPTSTDGTGGAYYFINATVGAISLAFPVGQPATFTSSLVLSTRTAFLPAA
jgi:hypothetical protein